MSAPKAKGTTMVDKKLKKEKAKTAQLQEQLRAAQFGLLNMRQMYEGLVGEKQGLQGQLQRTTQMLLGAVVQARGKKLVLKGATLKKLSVYAGIDTAAEGEDLVIWGVTVEALEAMQEDLADDDA